MKVLAASAFLGIAVADMAHMITDFQELYMNVTGTDRIFSGTIANSIATMNEMGCWCFFDEDFNRGHGLPTGALDQLCKNLNNCYQCALVDGQKDGAAADEVCDEPYNTVYNSGVGIGDLFIACSAANPGDACGSRVCSCEGSFVENLLAFFIGGGSIDPSQKHANGFVFDARDGDCAVTKTGAVSEEDCCGDYPQRRPFKLLTTGGERGCCGTRIFSNAAGMQCCDASISKIGYTC